MKLVRVGPAGREVPAVLTDDGRLLDASGVVADIDGAALSPEGLAAIAAAVPGLPELPAAEHRFGAPIARPGKVVCIGLNYALHAKESGADIPGEPVVFLKTTDTVVGPHDEVLVPRGSTKTDYEVELAVVIGRRARYLADADEALACVAGYAVSNDVSEREFQLERGGQWDKGKSCETFNPLGPWLVTADEVPDPQALRLWLSVDGQVRQDGGTSDMVFGVAEIVRYLSQFMVLEPGDVINTGTPAGVALGHPEPKPYLRAGQVVELGIDGLGVQRQVVGQA
ncbi:fumarylacetoacetate hydrolase family protein [Kineococcus rubinsiae]|uniref:fumarylacetoacetate hydrolase family protein n=1 Tax=Kineococcus rubinsiae TaxID=2609562 RepID=UPI00142F4A62|nr:fumarylacetoacetate hydrolase family protein [Kineococcus rubinsiae]NIZ89739.1 fumarylacetoacetate hydrolase family protein [Kineococcus rubinsiae]